MGLSITALLVVLSLTNATNDDLLSIVGYSFLGTSISQHREKTTTSFENDFEGIAKLAVFPPFPSMLKVTWSPGDLTEFPDLRNISSTLQTLNLDDNMISVINREYLEGLAGLRYLRLNNNRIAKFPATRTPMDIIALHLDNNPLISMPDFGTISDIMTELHLAYTGISVISAQLRPFSSLIKLEIQYSNLTTIPTCSLFMSSMTIVNLLGNPLEQFDPRGKDLRCIKLHTGLVGAKIETVPNFCLMPVLPNLIRWGYINQNPVAVTLYGVRCDCSVLWLKVFYT